VEHIAVYVPTGLLNVNNCFAELQHDDDDLEAMASPTPSEYHDCEQNPLTNGESPPPSPPLLALPLRGPIYENLFPSTSDLGHSDSESAFAHDNVPTANVDDLARSLSNTSLDNATSTNANAPTSATSSTVLATATTNTEPFPAVPIPAPPQRQPSHRSQRPYWPPQQRSLSNASYRALLARQDLDRERLSRPPIVLEDHSEAHRPEERTLWAKHVSVDDYVVVGNTRSLGAGAFVVWHCTLILDVRPKISKFGASAKLICITVWTNETYQALLRVRRSSTAARQSFPNA